MVQDIDGGENVTTSETPLHWSSQRLLSPAGPPPPPARLTSPAPGRLAPQSPKVVVSTKAGGNPFSAPTVAAVSSPPPVASSQLAASSTSAGGVGNLKEELLTSLVPYFEEILESFVLESLDTMLSLHSQLMTAVKEACVQELQNRQTSEKDDPSLYVCNIIPVCSVCEELFPQSTGSKALGPHYHIPDPQVVGKHSASMEKTICNLLLIFLVCCLLVPSGLPHDRLNFTCLCVSVLFSETGASPTLPGRLFSSLGTA